MNSERFSKELRDLYLISLGQKVLRVALRSAWLVGSAYLLVWGASQILGQTATPSLWRSLGAIGAGFAILTSFLPVPSMSRFAWSIDRVHKMAEQVSTGLMVSQRGAESEVERELLADTAEWVAERRKPQLLRGWRILPELEAAAVVVLLLVAVQLGGAGDTSVNLAATQPLQVPALRQAPSGPQALNTVFAGLPADSVPSQGQGEGLDEKASEALTAEELAELSAIMENVGEGLLSEGEVRSLGEALEVGDLDEAAKFLEQMRTEELSDDASSALAEGLTSASEQLATAGLNSLSEKTGSASDALSQGEHSSADRALSGVAEDLKAVSEQFSRQRAQAPGQSGQVSEETGGEGEMGSGAGSEVNPGGRSVAQSEPLERLDGGSETLQLNSDSSDGEGGSLQPGETEEPGTSSRAGGAFSYEGPSRPQIIDTILTPYEYAWKLRDVVATYFSIR